MNYNIKIKFEQMDFLNFYQRFKKVFWSLGILIIAVIFGIILWKLFFQTTILNTPGTETGTPITTGNLPIANTGSGQVVSTTDQAGVPNANPIVIGPQITTGAPTNVASGGLTKATTIVSSPSINPTILASGQIQYYNQSDNKFYKINNNGQITALSDKLFYNVSKVNWDNKGDKAIIEYPDNSKILYNFSTKSQVTLPKHWQEFDFSPSDTEIVGKSMGGTDNNWIFVSAADGSSATAIESIGENSDHVISSWSPNNQSIALNFEGVDFNRQELFFVGQNAENFKSTIIEGRGLEPLWSQKGDTLLYSVYNSASDLKPLLWVVGAQGDSIGSGRRSLEVNTYASKCTFSTNREVYCAVPRELEQGAGIFKELSLRSADDIYKINLNTGQRELIAIPDSNHSISQVMVSSDQSYLYFTDATTNQIYQINLK